MAFAAVLLQAELIEADIALARAQLLGQPVAAALLTTWVDRWLHKHRP